MRWLLGWGPQTLLPGVGLMLIGIPSQFPRSPGCTVEFGVGPVCSTGWMCTASWIVCSKSCWVCVGLPSGVVLSSHSTEVDTTLQSPGSQETSALCPPVHGGVLGLPEPLRIAHWLTACMNWKPPCWYLVSPGSYHQVSNGDPRLFPPFVGSSRPRSVHPPTSESPGRIMYGRRRGEGTVVSAGQWFISVRRLCASGNRTPSRPPLPFGSTGQSSSLVPVTVWRPW